MPFSASTARATLFALVVTVQGVPEDIAHASRGATEAQRPQAGLLVRDAGLEVEEVSLADALAELGRTSGVAMAFSPTFLPEQPVSCSCTGVTVWEALTRLLSETRLTFVEWGDQVLIEIEPARSSPLFQRAASLADALPLRSPPPAATPRPIMSRQIGDSRRGTISASVAKDVQGTVTGRVTDAATGGPVPAAQVYLQGLDLGTVTRADGAFTIPGVPLGEHELRIERVGFRPEGRTIAVSGAEPLVVNVALTEQAIALEGLVVTGLPTEARRREIGTSLAQIDMSRLEHRALPSSEIALQTAGPGVMGMQNQGQVGGSGQLRLRGVSSVSMSNEPLIYVDGVRMATTRFPAAAAADGRNSRQQGFTWNDINMDDVERIEVIKGAAATALYGTEASSGVIQIFTKRGISGAPQWSFSTTQGVNVWPTTSSVINMHPTRMDIDVAARTGQIQRYTGSVRGGLEGINYYISGSGSDEDGIVRTQWSKHWTGTANIGVNLFEGARLELTNTYTWRKTRHVPDGNNRYGYLINVLRVGHGYLPGDRDHSWVLDQEYFSTRQNYIGGVNFNYLHGNFNHTLRLGLHNAWNESTGLQPYGWHLADWGTIRNDQFTTSTQTLEYVGSWETPVSGSLTSRFSWGGQLYDRENVNTSAIGEELPGPGNWTVSSTALRNATESRVRHVNAGFFFQETVSHADRLFVTAAARFDGSSTFGDDYGFEFYPKLSVSYVASDLDAWPTRWWDSFRLRGAVGAAGQSPATFDADRTWSTVRARGGQAVGLVPGNLGNPDLGPEKTTEVELGFDTGMFDGRLNVEFTYYDANTRNALLGVRPIPSTGFTSTQTMNVGHINNHGIEVGAYVGVLNRPGLNWTVGTDITTMNNKIVSMGEATGLDAGPQGRYEEGHAPPSYFGPVVQNPDEFADPIFEEQYVGEIWPTKMVNLHSDLTYGPVTLSALGEFSIGGHIINQFGYLNTIRNAWPACDAAQALEADGRIDQLTARERAMCIQRFTNRSQFIEPGDFFKLRNLSLAFRVPNRILPGRMQSATISVAGHNVFTITDYTGLDPEVAQEAGQTMNRDDYYQMPARRSFVTRVSVTF